MWILLPLVCFALAVLLHGVTTHIFLRVDSVRRFLMVGVPVGAGLLVVSALTFGFRTFGLAQVALYAFLCELYMFLFTLVVSSVSATILILLRRGPISESTLKAAYDPQGMVRLRLERLIKQGLITKVAEGYAVTAAGARLHRAFSALRRFFRHDTQ